MSFVLNLQNTQLNAGESSQIISTASVWICPSSLSISWCLPFKP